MITWVTDQVAIGNASDSIQAENKVFDAVLCVAIDFDLMDGFKYRHKVGLLDGPGNHPFTFMAAVLLLDSLVKHGKKVLVHCHEGKSRSVMVVATWMAWTSNLEFDAVLRTIMEARGVDIHRPALYALSMQIQPLLQKVIPNTNTQKG